MTVSLDARTPSASVHALSGSTPPGADTTMQPFGIATTPAVSVDDTFTPPGGGSDVVGQTRFQGPDAELIALARRVVALAERHAAGKPAVDQIQAQVRAENPAPPRDAPSEVWDPYILRLRAAEASSGLNDRWKVRGRMLRRLIRWIGRLTTMEPSTMSGLSAKAAASLAVRDGDRFDFHSEAIAKAVQQDVVRLAAVEGRREATASPALARLVAAWRSANKVARDADDRREQIVDALVLPEPPEALRFRATTDETYIGAYQNIDHPYGYTDPKKIEQLRAGVAPTRQSRADEIVAAYDAWMEACGAVRQAVGLPEAEESWTRTRDVEAALRSRVIATPAANAEDLRLKAEVAVGCFGTVADVEDDLAQAARDGYWGDTTASTAILLDVVRLLDRGAMTVPAPPTSNIRPAPLDCIGYPAGRYAGVPREVIETYRTFLDMELRFLNHEVYGHTEGRMHLWLDNPAGSLHGHGEPAPSTRAAAVLGALGLMPATSAEDERVADTRAA